ncbi:MAG TPA: YcxB family protein [Terriglobales bacterium]|jgi:hypothetical protein|nr:YcxB family protein [Terriglobales bacterium]
MKIVYRISEADYVDARNLFAANEPWYRRIVRRVSPVIGVLLLLTMTVCAIVVRPLDLGLIAIGYLTGAFLFFQGFALRLYFRKAYRKDRRFENDFTAEIHDEGIHISTSFANSQMKWVSFIRVLESANIFMLFVAPWQFLVFPKRSFAPEQVGEFRSLLQLHVTSAEIST